MASYSYQTMSRSTGDVITIRSRTFRGFVRQLTKLGTLLDFGESTAGDTYSTPADTIYKTYSEEGGDN